MAQKNSGDWVPCFGEVYKGSLCLTHDIAYTVMHDTYHDDPMDNFENAVFRFSFGIIFFHSIDRSHSLYIAHRTSDHLSSHFCNQFSLDHSLHGIQVGAFFVDC